VTGGDGTGSRRCRCRRWWLAVVGRLGCRSAVLARRWCCAMVMEREMHFWRVSVVAMVVARTRGGRKRCDAGMEEDGGGARSGWTRKEGGVAVRGGRRGWRRRLPWRVEGEEKIRVRVLGDEDDDVAESDWLIW